MATITTRHNKKGVSYKVEVRLRGSPAVTGTFRRLTDARAWAAQTETEIRARKYVNPAAITTTLYDALDQYRRTVSVKKAAKTTAREAVIIKRLQSELGSVRLTDLQSSLLAKYRDLRLAQVSAYTVRLEFALLSHLYRIARMEWGLPVANPLADVKRPAAPRGRLMFLDRNQARELLLACKKSHNKKLYPYVLTLLHTGMRPDEACLLQAQQINFRTNSITLYDTKNKDTRTIPMTKPVSRELRKLTGHGTRNTGHVFVAWSDKRNAQAEYFRAAWRTVRKKIGMPGLHLHDLRHTAASHLLAAGVDLRTLADILGHRTMAMVMRYTHLLDGKKAQAIEKIQGLGVRG